MPPGMVVNWGFVFRNLDAFLCAGVEEKAKKDQGVWGACLWNEACFGWGRGNTSHSPPTNYKKRRDRRKGLTINECVRDRWGRRKTDPSLPPTLNHWNN